MKQQKMFQGKQIVVQLVHVTRQLHVKMLIMAEQGTQDPQKQQN